MYNAKKEFIHSLTISLQEARETEYWLKLIKEADLNSSRFRQCFRRIDRNNKSSDSNNKKL